MNKNKIKSDLKYLRLLSRSFPNRDAVSTELINLQAIINLPKVTEHFISDIHGEYESFIHVLKNGSGVIKTKIEDLFKKELVASEKRKLATLVYYPEQTVENREEDKTDLTEWYEINLYRMIKLCKLVTEKYTRSRIRKFIPQEFAHIIEELLYEQDSNKESYYKEIINSIIELDMAGNFITVFSTLIQQFAIAHLHIIGDIYDRGPGAHIIMDHLIEYHHVDIQWGNHDILWMGAAAGSLASIANVVRLSLRYGNIKTIEEGYGISLRALALFGYDYYDNDPCLNFMPKDPAGGRPFSGKERDEMSKMHKSITIIQQKLEGLVVTRNPQWKMSSRCVFDNIDIENRHVKIDGTRYNLNDTNFPTFDPKNPYQLNPDELEVIESLYRGFVNSEKLQKHVRFLFSNGSLYKCYNSNLLFHGCIPLKADGSFQEITINSSPYSGKKLIDKFDLYARQGYFAKEKKYKTLGEDILWYLWAGKDSPLFAKEKMATFERYFIDDKNSHTEKKNSYYTFRDDESTCDMILTEFGLGTENTHIVNGHVPVKVKKGEEPLKSNGKLIVIDGGFSKAYQGVTGIAGYTLVYNSYGISLVSHEPFESTEDAIEHGNDIVSTSIIVDRRNDRILVKDTDTGKNISRRIDELKELLFSYRRGVIVERWY